MTDFQRRILAYLDQHGGRRHRIYIVQDLSPPDSTAATHGTSQNAARLVGAWCKSLISGGLVRVARYDMGCYECHEITDKGRRALYALTETAS